MRWLKTSGGWSCPIEMVSIHNGFGFLATVDCPMGCGSSLPCRTVGILGRYPDSFHMKIDPTHDLQSPRTLIVCFVKENPFVRVV